MQPTLTFKSLMIATVVIGLTAANLITTFPTGSWQAILLAVASFISFCNFGYLVYIQDKETA
jgi:hypothetical protein